MNGEINSSNWLSGGGTISSSFYIQQIIRFSFSSPSAAVPNQLSQQRGLLTQQLLGQFVFADYRDIPNMDSNSPSFALFLIFW